jgi:archaellum component FlaC
MNDSDNLEERVTMLEQSVERVRSEVIEANLQSALAHDRSVQALHDDVRDLRRETKSGFAGMEVRFTGVDVRFAEIRAGLWVIVDRLDRLIGDA